MNGVNMYTSILCMLMVYSGVAENVHAEYERSGTCNVSKMQLHALLAIYSCRIKLLYSKL